MNGFFWVITAQNCLQPIMWKCPMVQLSQSFGMVQPSGSFHDGTIGFAVRADFRRLYPANAKTPTCCPSNDNRTKVTNSVTSAQSLWWHVGPYFWPADLTRTANPINCQKAVAWYSCHKLHDGTGHKALGWYNWHDCHKACKQQVRMSWIMEEFLDPSQQSRAQLQCWTARRVILCSNAQCGMLQIFLEFYFGNISYTNRHKTVLVCPLLCIGFSFW